MNLYALFLKHFPEDRGLPAIIASGRRNVTWAQLDETVARLAHLLSSLRLPPGARVAAQVDKSPEALFLYLACLRAGLVYLPLNPAYRAAELDYFLGDAEPSVFVCDPQDADPWRTLGQQRGVRWLFTLDAEGKGSLIDAAAGLPHTFEPVERAEADVACLLYTSGTTGRSKGAMLTHGNLASNALVLKKFWHWQPGDVLLHALPIFHIHGLFVAVHGALLNGSAMIWLRKFDVETVVHLLPHATVFMGVPTMYVRLLNDPRLDQTLCAKMRLFVSGSAPLLHETFEQFQERTGHTILERYGMSETGMLTSNSYGGLRLAGSVGKPLLGVSLRVVNEAGQRCAPGEIGRIEVKGPNVFTGYWRNPEKTREEFTEDGYFKTGDLGCWDEHSPDYLRIVGRSKDLIITGGYNVYPKEVELLIDEIPGVEESAVVGLPDPDFGEAVTAIIVRRPDSMLKDAGELLAYLKPQLANYKLPKQVHFVDELPRNAMGKVQKNLLRQQLQTQ